MLQLIELLRDGRFHSGEELGSVLGVSRSAVWKKLQLLKTEYGLDVHSVKGRGYRLAVEFAPLTSGLFVGDVSAWNVFVHESLDSTNAEALRMLETGAAAPFAVAAEMQISGRGRRGRRWVSPYGQNIYFSLALKVERGARQLEGLSLVVGLAVLRSLQELGVKDAGLKWPNDVLVAGKKIAGILLELIGDLADVCHVVVGIGINVNMCTSTETIEQEWTSLRSELGERVDRNVFLASLQRWLDSYFARFSSVGFSGLRAEWEMGHLWQGRQVSLLAGSNVATGVAIGVDDVGALRLQVDGVERVFSGGELSLRLSDDS